MPRAATITDVFNAIAEPRRREIVAVLVDGKEHAVGKVVSTIRLPHSLEVVKEEEIAASIDIVFETLLEQLYPHHYSVNLLYGKSGLNF